MRFLKTIPLFAAILIVGAGCMPSGSAIPSVERITFSPTKTNMNAPTPPSTPEPLPEGGSGVRGKVMLGPTCPMQKTGDGDCADKPYQVELRISTKGGIPVKRFTSGADGSFAVALIPDTYVIGPPPGAPAIPGTQDQEFTVRADAWTEIAIMFDTGIR